MTVTGRQPASIGKECVETAALSCPGERSSPVRTRPAFSLVMLRQREPGLPEPALSAVEGVSTTKDSLLSAAEQRYDHRVFRNILPFKV